MNAPTFVLEAVADSALLLRLGDEISIDTTARVAAISQALRGAALSDVVDIVPGYASVTVVLAENAKRDTDSLAQRVHELASSAVVVPSATRLVEIPVAYGGDGGPDLAALAAQLGFDVDELVARHTAGDYTVAMVGFLPGFPYLVGLDPALAAARHATPRTRVPAGSVGIGGAQTGIYPVESPGGWQLIGRTAAKMFDPASQTPSLLLPGDRVRFRAIAASELARTAARVIDGGAEAQQAAR